MRPRKKKKTQFPYKHIGVGICILGGFIFIAGLYIYSSQDPLSRSVRYFVTAQVDSLFNIGKKEAYGKVESIGGGMLVLTTQRAGVTRVYQVRYNEGTKFYMFAPDAELSEVELSAVHIRPGTYVSVTTTEPISTRYTQEAVSVVVM